MKGKIKAKKKSLTLLLLLFITSMYVSAQDYAVTPLSDVLNTYSQKYMDFLKEIESKETDPNQKLIICANKLSELKSEFKSKRALEYKLKSVKRAKRQSCQGTRVRGVTECGPDLINVPSSNMYTKEEWITLEGSDKMNAKVLENSSVSLKMTATSTRLNKGTAYVIFKYKPDLISGLVEKETKELFNLIIKNSSL